MRWCLVIAGVLSIGGLGPAQESAPASRPERWRFRQIDGLEPSSDAPIILLAEGGRDRVIVRDDGSVFVRLEKTTGNCTGSWTFLEAWTAQLPREALEGLRWSRAPGIEVKAELTELLDRVRLPMQLRRRHFRGGMSVDPSWWQDRHQEGDGSWSPADIDWHCVESQKPCTGLGTERFRMAATALFALGRSNLGRSSGRDETSAATIRYLAARARSDGRFADSTDPVSCLTNAVVTLALCRDLIGSSSAAKPGIDSDLPRRALAALAKDQNSDGGWGTTGDPARRLSVAIWSLLALQAGTAAGISVDPTASTNAVTWIERTVESLEQMPAVIRDPLEVRRTRATRLLARALLGAPRLSIADELRELLPGPDEAVTLVHDAETILFGTLTAIWCRDDAWEAWLPIVQAAVRTRETEGCARESWTTPCVWSAEGGRLVSTGLMTCAMEIYYRYPKAIWLDHD